MTTTGDKDKKASKPGDYNYMQLFSEWQLTNTDFSWMERAKCKGADADLFFADTSVNTKYAEAKRICAACPVYKQCMKFAIDNDIKYGIWGGLTPGQRARTKGKVGDDFWGE